MSTKEVKKHFGYAKGTNIYETKLKKYYFISHFKYNHPSSYWTIKTDYALVDYDIVVDLFRHRSRFTKGTSPHSYGIGMLYLEEKGNKYFLVLRKLLPFWMLSEYGGSLP